MAEAARRRPVLVIPSNPAITHAAAAEQLAPGHRLDNPFDSASLERDPRAPLAPPNRLRTDVIRNVAHVRRDSVRWEAAGGGGDEDDGVGDPAAEDSAAASPSEDPAEDPAGEQLPLKGCGPAIKRLVFEVDLLEAAQVTVLLGAEESVEPDRGSVRLGLIPGSPLPASEAVHGPFRLEPGMRQLVAVDGCAASESTMAALRRISSEAPKEAMRTSDGLLKRIHALAILAVPLSSAGAEGGGADLKELTSCGVGEGGSIKVLGQKLTHKGGVYATRQIYGRDDGGGEDEGAECIICMTDPREYAVLPCGHFCLCASCQASMLRPNSTCPLCRNPVAAYLRLGPRKAGAEAAESKMP